MSVPSKIIELRELLAEKFPTLPQTGSGFLATGVTRVDTALGGGLPTGGMTEIVCETGGGGLLLTAFLTGTLHRKGLMALVDGTDTFDPFGMPKAALRRLLWVRGRSATRAVQAADLLLRDGNLGLVVIDLRSNPPQEIGKIPSTSWYRLQRVVEPTATAFVVLTRRALVCAARPRLVVRERFALDAIKRRRTDLLDSLNVGFVRGANNPIRLYA